MQRIRSVTAELIDLPTIRPHVLSVATMKQQTLTLVRIGCDDGIEGIGEATTIGGLSYGPESPETIKTAIDSYFTSLLLELDAEHPARIMQLLGRAIVGNHFAKCAVETALWDAAGKRLGVAVSELIGGRVREDLPVLWTLAAGDTSMDIDEAQRMLAARRHNMFKLKIGKQAVARDIAHVAAIKKALGSSVSIRVDVNQAWDEVTARWAIDALAGAGVDLVEQPIARSNFDGMARLSARAGIPLMADEALQGPADAFTLARIRAADIFALKIEASGGLLAAREVAAIADAAGIGLYGGTMLEGAVGTVASAQLFATLPKLDWGTELFGPLLLTEEILAEPLGYGNFRLQIPSGPGLGILLDEDRVAFFRRDRTRDVFQVKQGAG
jgi:muconate cycloisomerase